MALFDRFRSRGFRDLDEFLKEHPEVEAYFEPQTPFVPQSLLLVAPDGKWTRAPAPDRRRAAAFCRKRGIPFYDAAVVGYPDRMRGVKKGRPAAPSAEELEKWFQSDSGSEG
jgi:hypothetical protein